MSDVNNVSERTSPCANGATWTDHDATTQVLVVNTRAVIYDEAIGCCQENFVELIKIDTREKMTLLSDHLRGLFNKSHMRIKNYIV